MEDWFSQILGNPDMAQSFASAGVPPPPLPPLGQSLEPWTPGQGVPGYNPNVPGGYDAGTPVPPEASASAGLPGRSPLTDALRGVPAQARPTAPTVGTPHAPTPRAIQGGELANLLMLLAPPQRAAGPTALPATLTQALGGR